MNADDQEQPMLLPEAPSPALADTEELDRDVAWLRAILFWVVTGLLMLSVGVNLFFWRQVQNVRAEIAAERKQIEDYNQADPAVRDLMRRLHVFAAAHPDFQPIMAKYGQPATNAPAMKR